jgi:hypothetical protein
MEVKMYEKDSSAKKIENPEELLNLMAFYPTLAETACWFSCSEDSIGRRIKAMGWDTFNDFRNHYAGKTRLLLKRKAISKALEEDNEKMLLYCLRTMTDLDDRQKPEEKEEKVTTIRLCYSDKDL